MTIFGFNTDIRYGDTVYHVQTEAHEAELKLQSAVFVRGRCIGKHSVCYADDASKPEFCESYVHDLLTRQHKFVVGQVREGKVEDLFKPPVPAGDQAVHTIINPPKQDDSAPLDVSGLRPAQQVHTSTSDLLDTAALLGDTVTTQPDRKEPVITTEETLTLEWLSQQSVCDANNVRMSFRLRSGPRAVEGARVIARLEAGATPAKYANSISDCEGEVELSFALSGVDVPRGSAMTMLVQAGTQGRSVTRKFRLRRP